MGNGGCGCNVTNSNLVSEQVLSRKSNRKKLLNLDLTIIDLKLCEQYEIGPYITRAYATKLSSGFTNKSLIILNSYISLLNYPKKLRKVKEIETIIDYEILTSQNNLLKIYDKIFETTDDKLKETLNFCWNNTLRLLIFVIILIIENKHDNRNPKITNEYVTSNSEKLILKDNKNNIQEDKKEETLLNMINKDVPRTLSEKISSCEILSYNLRDILLTVSMQDNTLGYVQGMNFITAFILILTGNQKNLALDLFKSILNMHSDLFNMNFKGIIINFKIR